MRYIDDYPSCEQTYATLRIYLPNGTDPDQVARALDVEPSHTQRRGERRGETTFRVNAWFLTSEGQVESRDVGRHMDWVLDQIASALPKLAELREKGADADISCYWLSRAGHGGPTISPPLASRLAEANLACWFDVYFTE